MPIDKLIESYSVIDFIESYSVIDFIELFHCLAIILVVSMLFVFKQAYHS